MATTTQKKKLSKAAWFLVFLLIGTIIAVVVLAAIGYISLQFLADALVGYMVFGSLGWMEATISIVLPFLAGILFFWIVKTYFIGEKTKGAIIPGAGGYAPAPAYPAQSQNDTKTEIG